MESSTTEVASPSPGRPVRGPTKSAPTASEFSPEDQSVDHLGSPAISERAPGVDGISRWIGLRWTAYDRVELTIRPELINPAGLLAGSVTYALVDYCMGSTLWQQRESGERIATISISINYVQTAREGVVACESSLDRRNDRIAVLSSRVSHEDGRLLATAIGSYSIFPRERLKGHDRGPSAPE